LAPFRRRQPQQDKKSHEAYEKYGYQQEIVSEPLENVLDAFRNNAECYAYNVEACHDQQ
jgi:hypothetical protein